MFFIFMYLWILAVRVSTYWLLKVHSISGLLNHICYCTDAGRFQSSPSLCAWRNAEQGLLGSGVFARVHRGVAETSDPVLKGSGFHILNRSSEPYRPPHLCKVCENTL